MSDKPAEGAAPVAEPIKKKKGKGKLPILLLMVLVLGGGGFFAFKAKGGSAKAEVKLGEIVDMPEELVNLKTANTFARVEVSVHLREGFQKADFEKHAAALEDALIGILRSKTVADVSSQGGAWRLKQELGEAFNKIVAPETPAESAPKEPEADAGASEPEAKEEEAPAEAPPAAPKHDDWVSETGPVLKVYFRSFATQ